MITYFDFQDVIEKQLLHNRSKSLFYESANDRMVLNPSKLTIEVLKQSAKDLLEFFRNAILNGTYNELLEGISNKTIKLFMGVNQFLNFNREDFRSLQSIYDDVFKQVSVIAYQEDISETEIDHLFTSHYKNLRIFLVESNGIDIFRRYMESPDLFQIVCAEYTPEFQMELLNITLKTIKQPVLDLGCGRQGSLVHFLRQHGIEAYGMDRILADSTNFLFKINWLECTLTSNTWGTIISHMAFSNHFTHHHLKADGDFEIYAQKYMEILYSLKVGGSFIYAPSLSFIEELLKTSPNKSFVVETREQSTKAVRLK